MTIIAFVGSVFSPYYRWAWQRGRAQADNHCAINVALYGPRGVSRWAMTERGRRHVQREARRFGVGPSEVTWDGTALTVRIDEIANPLPRRVRGTVRIHPGGLSRYVAALDEGARHRWGPIAPCARAEVAFDDPAWRWQGHAYVDSNEGDEPITQPFTTWDWMRAPLGDGRTAVVYDIRQRGGVPPRLIGAAFTPDGQAQALDLPGPRDLATTGWGIRRTVRSEPTPPAFAPRVVRTLEDTPFYARSLVRTQLAGRPVDAMHETLSATRFGHPLVQAMLPWRMPRRA